MRCCTWWLTIALYFSALAASQGNETPDPQVVPLDDSKTKEAPMITVFDDEEVEGDDDKDMTEDDKGEMELLSRDFMDTNPKEVKGLPVFEREIGLVTIGSTTTPPPPPTTTIITTTTPQTTTTTPQTTTTTPPPITTTTTTPQTTTTTPPSTTTTTPQTTTTTPPPTTTTTTPQTTTTTPPPPPTTTTTPTTTPPTTPPPPPPTTTTTTTTTTPQTTTTTTTTPEPMPKCPLHKNNGIYYWTSPGFGVQNYPNNLKCGITGRSSVGSVMLTIKLYRFKLEKGINGMCSTDKLETTLVYNRIRTLCGKKFGAVIRSPSFNFHSSFTTNEAITDTGFGMFITATKTPCHQVIRPAAGVTDKIFPPRNQNYCEYRIVAPTGRQVQIDFVKSRLRRSQSCKKDFILLNGSSEKMYPAATSEIICGKKKVPHPMTSTKGEMYVAYKRTRGDKSGFVLKYTII